jgi:hypothetical protein
LLDFSCVVLFEPFEPEPTFISTMKTHDPKPKTQPRSLFSRGFFRRWTKTTLSCLCGCSYFLKYFLFRNILK